VLLPRKEQTLRRHCLQNIMGPFMRPCIECGLLSRGTRCATHGAGYRSRQNKLKDTPERKAKKKQYYNADYRRRAKHVRDTALLCHLCNKGARPNDPWQADHLIPGDPNSPLLPAHRSCNASRGANPLPQGKLPPGGRKPA